MKSINLLVVLVVIALSFFAACNNQSGNNNASGEVSLDNEIDSISYCLGVNIGENVIKQGLKSINEQALAKALKDIYAGDSLLIDPNTAGQMLNSYFRNLQQKADEANKKEGEEFLKQNKKKEGVVELPSGLQYKILKKGDGPIPTLEDTVEVHYHGTLLDGTVFDSSVDRGKPVTFPVNAVIEGWQEALQIMPVGSKWKLFIPPDLAYGTRGSGSAIAPNTTLIFEVELLDIK